MIETLDRPLDKNAMKLISSKSSVGRALVAPPDHEKARTAALREAFDKMATLVAGVSWLVAQAPVGVALAGS